MIRQILSRSFVLQQLRRVRAHLEKVLSQDTTRQSFLSNFPGVAPEHLRMTLEAIQQAQAREEKRSSGQKGHEAPPSAGLLATSAPLEERSFFSRDPIISNFQSGLEEYLETKETKNPIVTETPKDTARPNDFAVTHRTLSGLPPSGQPQGVASLLGAFEPTDPGWISAAVAKGLSLFRGKRDFNPISATPLPIADNARVVLVGDWGTGLPRAQKVAAEIRKVLDEGKANNRQQHVVHLGDVYYAGWQREYENRFLPYWPVRADEADTITSWSLNGNHEMYTGGHAYFDFLLRDPRFKKQEQSSFFRLFNNSWDILALDTAWDDAGLIDRRGVLKDPQADWIRSVLNISKRQTVLLSHHQLFTVYDQEADALKLDDKLKAVLDLNRITAWFWGHEHRCMLFNPFDEVQFGRCIGHGGVPVYMQHAKEDPIPKPGEFEYRDFIQDGEEKWALFGFAVMEFQGALANVRYINEDGSTYMSETITSRAAAAAAS